MKVVLRICLCLLFGVGARWVWRLGIDDVAPASQTYRLMSTFCLLLHFVCRSREETAVGRTEEASDGTEEANGRAADEVDRLKRDEKMREQ